MNLRGLLFAICGVSLSIAPAIAADRKPLVIGSTGQQQQIQSGDTLTVGAAKITGIAGSTQCVQASSVGLLSGTGSSCGGSGTVTTTGSPASGNLAKFSGSTSITNGDLSGDVATSGTLATTIGAGAVSLSKMANLSANSIIGNNTGSSATPLALSSTQATAMLDAFTSSLKGLAPASGGGTTNYLRADGSWAAPAGAGTVTTTGSPSSGALAKFSGSTSITNGDLSGDVTTSGTLATTLANTAVTAGSYTSANITVDAKGRVTAAANGTGGGGGGDLGVFWAYEEEAVGTAGGTSTTATWTTRVLNTNPVNSISGASISSNTITLPAGTYDVWASCPFYTNTTASGRAIRLFNSSDSTVIALGESLWQAQEARPFLRARFTLAATKNVQLQGITQTGVATNGLGVNMGITGVNNHFSDILIHKVS